MYRLEQKSYVFVYIIPPYCYTRAREENYPEKRGGGGMYTEKYFSVRYVSLVLPDLQTSDIVSRPQGCGVDQGQGRGRVRPSLREQLLHGGGGGEEV